MFDVALDFLRGVFALDGGRDDDVEETFIKIMNMLKI